MNISLSNVKTNSDLKSTLSQRERFSGFMTQSAKQRVSTEMSQYRRERGTLDSRLLFDTGNYMTDKAGRSSSHLGVSYDATNEELD